MPPLGRRPPLPRSFCGAFLAAVLLLSACGSPEPIRLAVFALESGPSVLQTLEGLRAGLDLPDLPLREAGGDPQAGHALINELAQEKLSLLLTLGTPALSLAAQRIKDRRVVFAMVANPYFSGAAYDPQRPDIHQSNITGLASPPPLAQALEEGRKLFPAYRAWGMVYNPLEGASVELSQLLARTARERGLIPFVHAAEDASQVPSALSELRRQGVRIIYLPPDGFSREYGPLVLQAGKRMEFLVVNGNPRLEGPGAALTLTLDYNALGREAAALARRVLAGEDPKAIPIRTVTPVRQTVDDRLIKRWSGYPPGT